MKNSKLSGCYDNKESFRDKQLRIYLGVNRVNHKIYMDLLKKNHLLLSMQIIILHAKPIL